METTEQLRALLMDHGFVGHSILHLRAVDVHSMTGFVMNLSIGWVRRVRIMRFRRGCYHWKCCPRMDSGRQETS